MKKFLSVFLVAVLLVTGISTSFVNVVAEKNSEAVSQDPDDKFLTVFDSNAYCTNDSSTTQVNGELVTSTDKGLWLGGNSWLSSNKARQDGLYMGKGGKTDKILERNNAVTANARDFEWQFQLVADNSDTINTSFVFHAGDDSDISSYAKRNNLFAVSLFGSEVDESKHCAVSNALVIEYGGNGYNSNGLGNMRPYNYDSKNYNPWKITDDSYLKLDATDTTKAIDLKEYVTVKIKMEGQKITVAIWQTSDKENTYREMSVNMYASVYKKYSYGDFAIVGGASTCNYRIKDMYVNLSREVFNSANYPKPDHKNTLTGTTWLANSRISTIDANKDRLYMDSWKASGEILEYNKAADTDLQDFELSFDYLGNGDNTRSAFMFHTNENSKTDDFWNRNYAFSFMIWGGKWDYGENQDYAVANSITLQIPTYSSSDANMMGKARPYGGYEKVGSYYKPSDDGVLKLEGIDFSKWMNVKIRMEGSKITVTVVQGSITLSKDFTIAENNLNLAKSGDFAIIQGGNQAGYRNMVVNRIEKDINVLVHETDEGGKKDDDSTDNSETESWYTQDFEKNSDGIVLNTTPKYPETSGIKTDETGNSYYQLTHDYTNANGTDGWSILSVNPDKKYSDFTLNFKVKLDSELNAGYHQNWHFLLVGFRSQGGVNNSNVLQICGGGAAFSVTKSSEKLTYTNNRIAYAGSDNTNGGTFDTPSGNARAGLSPDNVWHQVSVVAKGQTYKYYLDGELMMEVTDTQNLYKKGTVVIAGRTLNLQIDDVEILSPDTEIAPFEQEQTQTGLLYENDFQNDGDENRLKVVRGQNYGLVTDGENKYFHIDYEPNESNAANGPVNMTFGPSGIKNFTLNMNVRITNKVSEKWHSVILMGRTKSGISSQARVLTKGSMLAAQSGTVVSEVARSGPAAANTTSTYPCHDADCGISIYEWHKVSLVCDEWKYTLYIDGVKIIEGVDEYQLNKWGGFGLRTEGCNVDIDNIKIWGTPHYDLSFTEEVPSGVLYENNFENSSLDGITFTYYDSNKTSIMTEENGNKFLRAYPNTDVKADGKAVVTGNGNLLFTFGPPNAMDFELTFRLRSMSNTNENLGSTIVGIHSDPSNIKWDTVWVNILARGTSVSLKDSSKKLGIDNLIATTGRNRNGGTAYMPSDNRAFGVRPDGKWHDVKVVCKGYTYTLYVDGEEYITATDADKTFYKGYTVIGSNGCVIDVDDISLTNQ